MSSQSPPQLVGTVPAWPTPVTIEFREDLVAHTEELEAIILDRATYRADELLSQVGGWRTETDILKHDSPAIHCLTAAIYEACTSMHEATYAGLPKRALPELLCEAWGNVYFADDFQIAHIHHDSIWSGVYFVAVPEELPNNSGVAGCLNLYDPRPAAWNDCDSHDGVFSIRPKLGLLVMFPSWLRHSVSPHSYESRRISIAFNVGQDRPS